MPAIDNTPRTRFQRLTVAPGFLSPGLLRKIMSIVIFMLLWAILVRFTGRFHQIPGPGDVLMAMFDLPAPLMLKNIGISFFRVLGGFSLGVLIGVPVGVAIGYSRILNHLIFPFFEMLRPIPPIAWIPLAVLFFVNFESQAVFLTFYGAFFPIVYNTMSGIAQMDTALPRAAMSFGVGKRLLLWKVILPAAMPQIFTGMKLAMGIAWILVVAAEMMSNNGGLGYYIWYNHWIMDYPHVVLGMGIIGLCGAISSGAVGLAGRHFTRWRRVV